MSAKNMDTKRLVLSINEIKNLHQAGFIQEAKQGYLELIRQQPKNPESYHYLGLVYLQEGHLEEAQYYVEKAISLQPQEISYYLHLANILKAKGQISAARQMLETILQRDPCYTAALNNLGTLYFSEQKWLEANHCFQLAVEQEPDHIEAFYNLGLSFTKLQNYESARQAYIALIAISKQHLPAHFQLALLYMRQEQYPAAIDHLLVIESLDPEHLETQINLANCYLKQGELYQAKVHYLKALDISPDDKQLYFNIAIINMQQGHIEEAIEYYQLALKIDTHYYEAHNNLAIAYLFEKNKKKTLEHLQIAHSLKPTDKAISHTIDIINQNKQITRSPKQYIENLFDYYADHYESHLLQTLQYKVPTLILNALTTIKKLKHAQYQILDLGCGTGLAGLRFKPYANKLIGIDLSQKMLAIAEQKNIYNELHHDDLCSYLENHSRAIDIIIACDTLVYIGDLAHVISCAAKALNEQGLFAFNTEISDSEPFTMTNSGRFAHHKDYIEQLAYKYQFNIIYHETDVMRTQEGETVYGYLFILEKDLCYA
jgi:predicted TPR repeat methyltransferase